MKKNLPFTLKKNLRNPPMNSLHSHLQTIYKLESTRAIDVWWFQMKSLYIGIQALMNTAAAIVFIVPNTNKKYEEAVDIRLYHRFYYTLRGKKSYISKVFQ